MQAVSEGGTPRSGDGAMGDGERAQLERRISALAEAHGGMVPAHVAASMKAHHHLRPPAGRHGMLAMGSTLVLVNERRDSVEVRTSKYFQDF